MKIYLDGKYVDQADAKVSVFDHGLLYGDGVFEGIRLYGGNIFRLDEHLERLEYSAKAILLDMPLSRKELTEVTCETCRQNQLTDAYIRLVVTRGVGDLGLAPWLCAKPSIFVIASKIALYPQEHYDNGLAIVTVPTRRINPAALPATVKSLNYLNNILGKIEARQFGALEAIMLNDQGYVAECTADNVFIVHKGELITPAASQGALKGITTAQPHVITALKLGLAIGLGLEIVRKLLRMNRRYVAFATGTRAGRVTDFIVDAFLLSSPYASSFGGFVEIPTLLWWSAGGIIGSLYDVWQDRHKAARPAGEPELSSDMSTTSLVGGGLIAGDSLAALSVGIYGLLQVIF